MEITERDIDRFWGKVRMGHPDECWLWTTAQNPFGYGQFALKGRTGMAHRFSWVIENGIIPAGMYVCHLCDNPPCVNPLHLIAGTPSLNQIQRRRRGRHSRANPAGVVFYPLVISVRKSFAEKYWDKVDRRGEDECWLWQGPFDKQGYGRFNHGTEPRYRAHRLALELAGRPLRGDEFALHSCDTPACVNPSHLRAGTARDNHADCIARGRVTVLRGEDAPSAKLNWQAVRALRAEPWPQPRRVLAAKYGISLPQLDQIITGKDWLDPSYTPPPAQGPRCGERSGTAKLTWEQVRAIRAEVLNEPQVKVAARYGVSPAAICLIVSWKNWKE